MCCTHKAAGLLRTIIRQIDGNMHNIIETHFVPQHISYFSRWKANAYTCLEEIHTEKTKFSNSISEKNNMADKIMTLIMERLCQALKDECSTISVGVQNVINAEELNLKISKCYNDGRY